MDSHPAKDYFALQAEWLRLRSRLFDKNTNLPTLAGVLEDVRKMTEDEADIGVIYLSVDQEVHIEETFGWQLYDQLLADLARALERAKGTILNHPDTVAIKGIRGDEFIIFVRCSDNYQQRLEAVQRDLLNHIERTKIPYLPHEIDRVGMLVAGSSVLDRDARLRFERLVYQAVDRASANALRVREGHRDQQQRHLRELLDAGQLQTLFQPIIHLESGEVFGHEALSRGPENSGFENAEVLFSFAEQTDLIFELERQCRRNALRYGRSQQRVGKIFINSSVQGMYDQEFQPEQLSAAVAQVGLANSDIVFEITERVAIHDWKRFQSVLRDLKDHGFSIAIDDMGAGYSNLSLLTEIEPEFLKFDISLVRGVDKSLMKLELLKTLLGLAQKIGAKVIAEGLESEAEYQTVKELGIPYGQGFFLARPALCRVA
jgi:EAL domain-containing protein (putative c-di-GMP-specific phosphodiesterase class I)/GGDEF domain-containing protein